MSLTDIVDKVDDWLLEKTSDVVHGFVKNTKKPKSKLAGYLQLGETLSLMGLGAVAYNSSVLLVWFSVMGGIVHGRNSKLNAYLDNLERMAPFSANHYEEETIKEHLAGSTLAYAMILGAGISLSAFDTDASLFFTSIGAFGTTKTYVQRSNPKVPPHLLVSYTQRQ